MRVRGVAVLAAAFVVAGCGSDDDPAASVPSAPAASVSVDPAVDSFRTLANDVCLTVRQATPAGARPTPDASRTEIVRYARTAAPSASAMARSIRRLPAPESVKPAVMNLAAAYADAGRAYRGVAKAGAGDDLERLRGTLREQDAAITARAGEAGLPGCGTEVGR